MMGDLVRDETGGLISLINNNGGGLGIPKPFERDVFLFDTHVAGTSYVEGIMELEPHLKVGDKLVFYREADNQFDEKAIVIKNENAVKLGYVPRKDNVVFSRLMDAGKLLFGRITSKESQGDWVRIRIDIYLHE